MSVLSSPPPRPEIPKLDELDLELITRRLRLRLIREGDVEGLWPYVSDPEFPKLMSWAAHTDRSQTLAVVRGMRERFAAGREITWVIEQAGQIAGCIGLNTLEYEVRAWRVDRAELGYWLAPALWNQGFITEAAHEVVRCGFERLALHKVTVGCLVENVGSRRVIEKLGFRPVGRLEDDVWRDGRWWSMLRYEVTAAEWSDVSTTMRVARPGRA